MSSAERTWGGSSRLAVVSTAADEVQLQQLRTLGAELAPPPASFGTNPTLSSGIERLDQLLPGGGIPLGRLTELSGGRSSGKRSLSLAFGARARAQRCRVAWIDGRGGFYPLPSFEHGAPLERLLVVRLPEPRPRNALKATDMLLQAGRALTLIVIDADLRRRRISLNQLARLRLAAERTGTALLFISESETPVASSLGTFIALHLAVRRQGPRGLHVAIAKSKLGQMAHQTRIELDAPHSVCLDTTV